MGRIFETRKATMFARWNKMAKQFTRIAKEITGEIPVSFFALQIAVDRVVGPLRGGDYVSIAYVEDVYTHYEDSAFGTPVNGEQLDLALAYLAGRELALLGPDLS